MSKYRFQHSNIYQPGTNIPKNRLNITNDELLHEIEQNLLEQAYLVFVTELNSDTRFDEKYFQSLHYRTLYGLYDWAGTYRDVDMSKGESLFCRAMYIPAESKRIFDGLEREDFLRKAASWPQELFAERLAYYQCELIALHPFYECNGRIIRLFFDLIAIYNSYDPIDYSSVLTNESLPANAYIKAAVTCVQTADNTQLQQIILTGLNKS